MQHRLWHGDIKLCYGGGTGYGNAYSKAGWARRSRVFELVVDQADAAMKPAGGAGVANLTTWKRLDEWTTAGATLSSKDFEYLVPKVHFSRCLRIHQQRWVILLANVTVFSTKLRILTFISAFSILYMFLSYWSFFFACRLRMQLFFRLSPSRNTGGAKWVNRYYSTRLSPRQNPQILNTDP